ncbi:hypothetical protein B0J18DRAFT_465376 [Chaetomium sp. MPI-SDFR-AT-0129]|nr:hypothetical protein B0J18DRAFT_465376 [Chaetomium sp. MPI-SDFR-AT-0129]
MALPTPSTDPVVLTTQEKHEAYLFHHFNADTAWTLGTTLRTKLLSLPASQRKPAVISITSATAADPPHVLFQCATEPGTLPDNEHWVRRKRNTVLRWGLSSWTMRQKITAGLAAKAGRDGVVTADEVEEALVRKFGLASGSGGAVADEYAIHGGGYPVRVRGVEGVVAVVVVSGLKQEDDHAVVVEGIREVVASQGQ